ncbi:MAG TPA: cysteine desulfurase family protein [Candidatus Binataceae bacterium]|nr:cysteine desulfurase family protein [Candidatus Binataceae bacterium]
MRIYFDHNAGAPLRPAARDGMARFINQDLGGNPSSVHFSGQHARRLLERSRAEVASLLGAPPRTIVFTSGGTESNNLAIFGAVQNTERRRIVTSTIEHSSILGPIRELERRGFEVVQCQVDSDGNLLAGRNLALIDQNTALVSLGLANSEVGTIQNLAEFSEATRAAGSVFHVDAAQAVGRIPLEIEKIGCDLMSISAHKFGGPAGIGALYVRPGCRLGAQVFGGPQESGMRAGTPNLCGTIGFGAAALEVNAGLLDEQKRIAELSDLLLRSLEGSVPGLRLNGPREERLQNTLNLTFPGVLGESLLIALDLEGIEISMGSACAAGAVEPSHVLLAMGRSASEARSSVRLSLGWNTTKAEITHAAEMIPRVWRRVAASEPAVEKSPAEQWA